MKTLLKSLLLHPQRTLDLEYQDGGDGFKILLCMLNPVLSRSMDEAKFEAKGGNRAGKMASSKGLGKVTRSEVLFLNMHEK